jgi:hypothetical protein
MIRESCSMPVYGAAAHIGRDIVQDEAEFPPGGIKNLDGFGHDFRADSIPWQQSNFLLHVA